MSLVDRVANSIDTSKIPSQKSAIKGIASFICNSFIGKGLSGVSWSAEDYSGEIKVGGVVVIRFGTDPKGELISILCVGNRVLSSKVWTFSPMAGAILRQMMAYVNGGNPDKEFMSILKFEDD